MVRPDPGNVRQPDSVKDFAIVMYYKDSGNRVQVERVDTADDGLHIDRLYSERERKKKYLDEEMNLFEAWEFVRNNWKKWAREEWKSRS